MASMIADELYGMLTEGPLLDIGCGDKSVANLLEENLSMDVIGLDISRDWQKPDVKAHASFIPFVNESFDAVLLITVLEYVPNHLRSLVLAEATRVLRPLGLLVAYLPNKVFPVGQDSCVPFVNFLPMVARKAIVGHFVDLPSQRELCRLLFAAKFRLVKEKRLYHEYLPGIARSLTLRALPIGNLYLAAKNSPARAP